MGCCLIAALGLVGPRLVLFLMWLFTPYLRIAFDGSWFVPVLGFFFLPLTTIAWTWAAVSHYGFSGIGAVVIVLAFLFDIGILGGGRGAYSRRRA
jgi:hypothetical protein